MVFFLAHSDIVADQAMQGSAEALQLWGFTVADRQSSEQLIRAVGYERTRSPPGFRLPRSKAFKLKAAMQWMVSCEFVDVSAVHSLVGIWIFGALIRRDVLSAASCIFQFIEKYDGRVVKWWKSARLEFRIMSHLVDFMFVDVSLPAANTIFVSDAQGPGELLIC